MIKKMTDEKIFSHVPRNNSMHHMCPECGSERIYRETCMDCGVVIGKYYVNFESTRGDSMQDLMKIKTHELVPDYLHGSVIAYGEVLKSVKGRQRGVFRRLVKIQKQSFWWNNTYVSRIGQRMTEFMQNEHCSYEIRNNVEREWRRCISVLKTHNGRTIFLSHLAITVLYVVIKRYNPTFRMETLINYFGEDSSISRTGISRIIAELKIPYERPSEDQYVEVGIEAVAPMYYRDYKESVKFVPRLRENVKRLYKIIGVGGEDQMNLLCAVLYGACHIEAINHATRLPRSVTTPRVAERFGMLPYTVRCVYNRKIKDVVEKYRDQKTRSNMFYL